MSIAKHAAIDTLCKAEKLCSTQTNTYKIGAQLRVQIRSREAPAYRGMTMVCFHIIEEEQQAAQTSDSREMATSLMDSTAKTPIFYCFPKVCVTF